MLMPPIKFYNDTITLRFNTEEHVYYLEHPSGELEPLDGVTTVCGIMDKSKFLMPWACRVMSDKILADMPHTKDFTGDYTHAMDWSEFESLVTGAKRAHKEHLSNAADIGGAAHAWIDETIQWAIDNNGGIVDSMGERIPDDPRSVKCGEAAFDWMKRHKAKWLKTEHKIYSRQYKYAGTMDGLAMVDSCRGACCLGEKFEQQLSIVDWKSSNALRTEYLYQTAAYQQAEQEEFGTPIGARWILRLGKEDGKFDPWYAVNFAEDFEAFRLCLTLKRMHGIIEHRMAEEKKSRTALKRAIKGKYAKSTKKA